MRKQTLVAKTKKVVLKNDFVIPAGTSFTYVKHEEAVDFFSGCVGTSPDSTMFLSIDHDAIHDRPDLFDLVEDK